VKSASSSTSFSPDTLSNVSQTFFAIVHRVFPVRMGVGHLYFHPETPDHEDLTILARDVICGVVQEFDRYSSVLPIF